MIRDPTPDEVMEFLIRWVITFGDREVLAEERWDQDWYGGNSLTADDKRVTQYFYGYGTASRRINQAGLDYIKEKQK